MKNALLTAISETRQRAMILKSLINRPLEYPELGSFATKCETVLDSQIEALDGILSDSFFKHPSYQTLFVRKLRRIHERIESVEDYGVPVLSMKYRFARRINNILFKIHKEIEYPFDFPIAACYSKEHYWSSPEWNVIYVPLAEPSSLLYLPVLLHEFGHLSLFRLKEARMRSIYESIGKVRQVIGKHYQRVSAKKELEFGPSSRASMPMVLLSQWLDFWLTEFVCDVFATATVGPAYAWSFSYIIFKTGGNTFHFSLDFEGTHPSDDARMTVILNTLQTMRLNKAASQIEQFWKYVSKMTNSIQEESFSQAFPVELLEIMVTYILDGIKGAGIRIYKEKEIAPCDGASIIETLNEGWHKFSNGDKNFFLWQEKSLIAMDH